MTKTENYNLPQWEPHDPVRRTDFNAASQAIDAALTALDGRVQGSGDTAQQLAALMLESEYVELGDTLIQRTNRVLNPLSSAELANAQDGAEWDADGHLTIGRGPASVERTALRASCTNFTHLTVSTTYDASKANALYEFTSPVTGTITAFDMHYAMYFGMGFGNALVGGSLTFTAQRLDKSGYVTVYTKSGIPLELSGTQLTQGSVTVPVEAPLWKDYTYRLTLHLDSGQGTGGSIGFALDSTDDSEFTIQPVTVTSASHTRTVKTRAAVTRAAVVLRYWDENDGGGISASVSGVPMEEISRTTTAGDSRTEHEVWFFGSGEYGKTPVLTIGLHCGEDDRLGLLNYGVIVL